jgi:hypothetical protein
VIDETLKLSVIQKAGNLSEAWRTMDHIKGRAEADEPEYVKLLAFIEASGRTAPITIDILQASIIAKRDAFYEQIRNGSFVLTAETRMRCQEIETRLSVFDDHNPKFLEQKSTVRGVLTLVTHPDYNPDQMEEKLNYLSTRLVRCASQQEYMNLVFEIYNFKSREENRIKPRKQRN